MKTEKSTPSDASKRLRPQAAASAKPGRIETTFPFPPPYPANLNLAPTTVVVVDGQPPYVGFVSLEVTAESQNSLTLTLHPQQNMTLGNCTLDADASYTVTIVWSSNTRAQATITNQADATDVCTTQDVVVEEDVRAPDSPTVISHTQAPGQDGITVLIYTGVDAVKFSLVSAP